MDSILRGLLLFVVNALTRSQLNVTITPNEVDVEDGLSVTIRCSLDLSNHKMERVYSMMLLRRKKTMVVFLSNGKILMPEKKYNAYGVLDHSQSVNFLQVKLENVSCIDRGEYSCKMAARRDIGNVNFGPTSSTLKVIGAPSSIEAEIQWSRTTNAVGQAVKITCSALKKSQGSDWLWTLPGLSIQTAAETCTYNENACLFSCSSYMSYTVNGIDDSMVQCGYDGIIKRFPLNATTSKVKGAISEVKKTPDNSLTTTEVNPITVVEDSHPTKRQQALDTDNANDEYPFTNENGKTKKNLLKNILVYGLISMFALLFFIIVCLFISDRRRCKRFRRSKNLKMDNYSEMASEWSRGQADSNPDADTRLLSQPEHSYLTACPTQSNTLLQHQFDQVPMPRVDERSTVARNMRPSNHWHGTHHSGHFLDTSFMNMPHNMDRTHSNGHCINSTFMNVPHNVDRTHTNGHCMNTNFISVPNQVDWRRMNGTSTERIPEEHIYHEVVDVPISVEVPRGLVCNVGIRLENT